MKKTKRISPFIIAGIWAIFIFILSTVGIGVNLPPSVYDIIGWDKLAHAFVYFVLSYFLYKGFILKTSKQKAAIYMLIIAIMYGVLIEIIQYSFFPKRYFEFFDIFANIVGSILSLVYIYFLTNKKSQSYG